MNTRTFWLMAVALMIAAVGCGGSGQEAPAKVEGTVPESEAPQMIEAKAEIVPKSGSTLNGTAGFSSAGGEVTLTLEVENAPAGLHAVHLHEIGDCSADDAKSAGGHWNPSGVDHGKWGADPFHLGDIGNLVVADDGYGSLILTTDLWSIGTGEANDILGRAIIIHEKPDDFSTQPTGGAAGRIGCGVIE